MCIKCDLSRSLFPSGSIIYYIKHIMCARKRKCSNNNYFVLFHKIIWNWAATFCFPSALHTCACTYTIINATFNYQKIFAFPDPDKPEGYDEAHSQQTRISKCTTPWIYRIYFWPARLRHMSVTFLWFCSMLIESVVYFKTRDWKVPINTKQTVGSSDFKRINLNCVNCTQYVFLHSLCDAI